MLFHNVQPVYVQLTFPSGVLFSTQISSAGFSAGVPDEGTGGIPGGNSIPGGGGRFPMGGGRNGGLCSKKKKKKGQALNFKTVRGRARNLNKPPRVLHPPTKYNPLNIN